MVLDIRNDHALIAVHGRPAGAHALTNRQSFDGMGVKVGQTGGRAATHVLMITIEQNNRGPDAVTLAFDGPHDQGQHFPQRRIVIDALQHMLAQAGTFAFSPFCRDVAGDTQYPDNLSERIPERRLAGFVPDAPLRGRHGFLEHCCPAGFHDGPIRGMRLGPEEVVAAADHLRHRLPANGLRKLAIRGNHHPPFILDPEYSMQVVQDRLQFVFQYRRGWMFSHDLGRYSITLDIDQNALNRRVIKPLLQKSKSRRESLQEPAAR